MFGHHHMYTYRKRKIPAKCEDSITQSSSSVSFPACISSSAKPTYVLDIDFSICKLSDSRKSLARRADKVTSVYLDLISFCNESIDGSSIIIILQYLFILL